MKKYFFPILLVVLSLIPLIDLVNPGLPITHDGRDHVARIANFYQNLQEGNVVPRWAGNLNWGYGHPILMFLYPLPSYFASVFLLLGFSTVDSVKIVFGLGYILSGLTMYLWLREFLPKYAAFVGALLYIFAPYRFVDLYVRGAIGEHTAFIFAPLVFYYLLKISKFTPGESWHPLRFILPLNYNLILGSLSLAGLILAHNAISLMFLPLFFVYGIYLIIHSNHKKILISGYALMIVLGFALSAFFWMPAFFEGKYTLRDVLFQGGEQKHFSPIEKLIYSQWSYGISGEFSPQVGFLHLLSFVLSVPLIFYVYRKHKKYFWPLLMFICFFGLSIFLMIKTSSFVWEKVTIIQKFQFPWRFLTLAVFCSSVIGAILVSFIPRKIRVVLIVFIIGVILILNSGYWSAKDYSIKPDSYYKTDFASTTDTGESAPIWSVRFMEKFPVKNVEVIEGNAKVEEIGRKIVYRKYIIEASEKSRIRENTLYFPGWEVYINGVRSDIQFQDPENRGLMTFYVEKGRSEVEIKFADTRLRTAANIISAAGIAMVLVIVSYKVIKL